MPEPQRTTSWQRSFGSVKAFMLAAIDRGWTFPVFYTTMRETELSYRESYMRADWRSLQNLYAHETQLQRLRTETVVPEQYVTKEMYARNYNYIAGFDYDYFDPVTRETKTGWVGVTSGEPATKADYESLAWSLIGEGGPYYNPTASNLRLRYVIGRQ